MGKENTVAIIGGEGAMGEMTKILFQNIGFRIVSSDRKRPDLPTPREAVSESGVIFLSILPIVEVPKIIRDIEGFVSPDHVVLDNVGVKGPIIDSLRRLDSLGASVCSTHPLTRPDSDLTDLTNKQALIMGIGANSSRAKRLAKNLYASAGMETIPFHINRHDPLAVQIQLVPHLVMRAVQKAIPDLELGWIRSPNFEKFFIGFQSVISQNPDISDEIINSLKDTKAGKLFIKRMIKAFERLLKN